MRLSNSLNVFSLLGFAKIIGFDSATNYKNKLWKELEKLTQMNHRFVSAYHLEANAVVERHVVIVKDMIYKITPRMATSTWY